MGTEAEAIEAVRNYGRTVIDDNPDVDDVAVVQVVALSAEYVRHYVATDEKRYETQETEYEMVAPLVNPDTGRASKTFEHAGKLDVLAFDRWNNETVVVEHKSTSENLKEWSPYWRRLVIDSQLSKYLLQLRQNGVEAKSVLYDVICKPRIRPKVIKAELQKIVSVGTYCGFEVSDVTRKYCAEHHDGGKIRENLELYGVRLARDIRTAPADWFQRRMITRTDDEIIEYARDLWQAAAEIRSTRRVGRWIRNTANCNAFGRTCEFLPLCCGESDQASMARAKFVHRELSAETIAKTSKTIARESTGRDILTNSSVTTYGNCRKRFEYRYEHGLAKSETEKSGALFFGTLLHNALEIVWNFYRGT